MNNVNLLLSIPLGVLIILVTFLVMYKLFRLEILLSAFVLAMTTLLVYGVIAILAWPGADVFAIHLAVYMMTIYAMSIIARGLSGKTRWHWGPILIISFFVVVILTNTLFIFLAQSGLSPQWAQRLLPNPQTAQEVQSRFPGTVSHDFREKESQFNDYRQQRIDQQERGWQTRLGWQEQAMVGTENTLILEVRDHQGQAVDAARVSGKMLFPGNMKLDQQFTMSYQGNGRYTARLTMPHPGNWDFIILVEKEQIRHEIRVTTTVSATSSQ